MKQGHLIVRNFGVALVISMVMETSHP